MESVIISGDSIKDIHLLISIAEKMGLTVEHIVNKAELEDIGLAMAIQEGQTGEFIDTDKFLTQMKNNTH